MMMGEQDYFLRRAQQERARAERCTDLSAAHVHHSLAEEYDRRVRNLTGSAATPPER